MTKILIRSLLGLLLAYLLGKLFLGQNGLLRQFQIAEENQEISLQIDSLENILKQKQQERNRLVNDSLYIEQIARTRFGFSRKGEKVFQFLPAQDSLKKDSTQPPTVAGESK
jgi:cell division protein FtsB